MVNTMFAVPVADWQSESGIAVDSAVDSAVEVEIDLQMMKIDKVAGAAELDAAVVDFDTQYY